MAGAPAASVRLEVEVRGRVQGVGFRYFVAEVATARGVVGWVANEPDGSVRCVVEGSRPVLDDLLDELRRGPLGAHVEEVRPSWGGATGAFDHFAIRAGAHRGD